MTLINEGILTKARRVVDLVDVEADDPQDNDYRGWAIYASKDEYGNISDDSQTCLYITIDYTTYLDLGGPEQITVSVEPGNILQKEYDDENKTSATHQEGR